jgi:RimJ/RimL family protein N-acetyltransferase
MSVILSDGVVMLRPRTLNDVEAQIAGQDTEITRWLEWDEPTRANVTKMIEGTTAWWREGMRKYDFGIQDATTEVLIGNALANCVDPELSQNEANIAYAVFPSWRQRGVASRVVELLCNWLVDDPLIDTVILKIDPANDASTAVAKRLGFHLDATSVTDASKVHRYARKLADR